MWVIAFIMFLSSNCQNLTCEFVTLVSVGQTVSLSMIFLRVEAKEHDVQTVVNKLATNRNIPIIKNQTFSSFRRKIKQDPMTTTNKLRINPQREGRSSGWQLSES